MRFSKYPKDLYKDATRMRVGSNVSDVMSQVMKRDASGITEGDFQLVMSYALAASTIVNKKWHNIYVNSQGLYNFLKKTEIKADYFDFYEDCRWKLMEYYPNGVCIHVPNEKHSHFFSMFDYSKFAKLNDIKSFYGPFISIVQGGTINTVSGASLKDIYEVQGSMDDSFHILLNLMLYMDIFPECVEDGCPSVNKTPSSLNKKISLSEKISKSDTEREVSPHMRMGHFRVLRSERFTNKRFQAVYVKPCMVKGRAETVIDLKDAQNG